jgi:plasmid stabilization system protein ParE
LIDYSPRALRQIRAFRRHYEDLDRFEAVATLLAALDEAESKIAHSPTGGLPAPRPYPSLTRPGWAWVKAGRYWIGYRQRPRPVIVAVFFETANIPDRL